MEVELQVEEGVVGKADVGGSLVDTGWVLEPIDRAGHLGHQF